MFNLIDDTKRFETVDNEFKEIMKDIQLNPGVIKACCSNDGREQLLQHMFKELEKCEKALNEYLDIKKSAFPRFYFVSNAALLDILSNGNNLPKITPHMGSIFDGIGDLELVYSPYQLQCVQEDPENYVIGSQSAAKAMISKDHEIVTFIKLFEIKNLPVEIWLDELVKYMQYTLKYVLNLSMIETASWNVASQDDNGREEWVFSYPAQIALITSQIVWTEEVEATLEELEGGQEDALRKYNEICTQRLEGLIKLVQGNLSKEDRIKIITIITIDVHNRDVVTMFIQKKVESNIDFNWQSQLRYYYNAGVGGTATGSSNPPPDNTSMNSNIIKSDEKNVNIRICDFSTVYSFEYVGNCGRLVITPLTDRCYVTLTTALRLTLGGAPAGPGKLYSERLFCC